MNIKHKLATLGTVSAFFFSAIASATPLNFDFTAQSFPGGQPLTGQFSYDPDAVSKIGTTEYFPNSNTAKIAFSDGNGFSLTQSTKFISVQPGATTDRMIMQTFLSEAANDWHIVLEITAPGGPGGWLQGDSSLPSSFPVNPTTA